MAENAEKGFFNGGQSPYGYRRVRITVGTAQKTKLETEDTEAAVVRRIFQMALAGQGTKEIAKRLNRDGLRTRNSNNWSKTVLHSMLRNEIYTGTLVWRVKKDTIIRSMGAHVALVSRDDFDRTQQLLKDRRPKIRHPRTVSSHYLLSPLLRCAGCGTPMIGCSAKSGRFFYYRCNNALKRDPQACRSGWLPKDKIEGFVINRLKKNVLTDDNLAKLVTMANQEIRLIADQSHERVEVIDRELDGVNQKLLKYYTAFENGTISDEDAAPRIRELRLEQGRLQKAKDESMSELEDSEPGKLDKEQVLDYVKDLKALLSKGTLMEQKTFLRSFIKKIDFEPGQVAIHYTIPMPIEKGRTSEQEVLPIGQRGERCGTRTHDALIKSHGVG